MTRLAIDGGEPVRGSMLPYGRQSVDSDDVAAVVAALQSDWLTTGPMVARFEEAFATAVGARHAVAVANGTAALHAAVAAAGIGPGDEVVTTPMTFAATSNAVLYAGGRPVFADVCADTLNLDPAAAARAITPRTRAIIAVDYAGVPADLAPLRRLAAEHKLTLIEDAAHSLGASYEGTPVGAIADLTTFSLHPVKVITTAEGGVITTGDERLAERMRRFRNHGMTVDAAQRAASGSWIYEITDLGFNYRLTDLQCALGLSQLAKLDTWVARRRGIVARYNEALAGLPVDLPATHPGAEPAWHLYPVRLQLERLRADRRTVFQALRAENIGVNVHYIPVPWHPLYARAGYRRGEWPVAESAYERLVSLPIWPGMTQADQDDTIAAVRKVLAAYAR